MDEQLIRQTKQRLLKTLAVLIVFVTVVTLFADYFYWFNAIWWFDMPMHFLGGMVLMLISLLLFFTWMIRVNSVPEGKELFKATILIALFTGIGWEVFEVVVAHFTTHFAFNTLDTLSDICFDLAGAIFLYFIFLVRYPDSYKK